jgi:hypothetical protein
MPPASASCSYATSPTQLQLYHKATPCSYATRPTHLHFYYQHHPAAFLPPGPPSCRRFKVILGYCNRISILLFLRFLGIIMMFKNISWKIY